MGVSAKSVFRRGFIGTMGFLGFLIAGSGWAAEGAGDGNSAFRVLAGIRRCFELVRGGDPTDLCEQAFHRWVYQRVYCPDSRFGGDYILAPAGTIRRYRRRYYGGRADTEVVEWVAKLRVEEGPSVRMWVTRSGEGLDSLSSYLVDGRSGFTFFDSMEIGNRAVTCQSLEPFLPAAAQATSWTGSGCWLTDSVSASVYPHGYRSAFADLFLPGSLVGWRYRVSPAPGPISVKAGEFTGGLVRRSLPFGGSGREAEFEEVFVRGIGRVRSAGFEDGRPVWVEELERVSFPTRPRDPEQFCSGVE